MSFGFPYWILPIHTFAAPAFLFGAEYYARKELPEFHLKDTIGQIYKSFLAGCTLSALIAAVTPAFDYVCSPFLPPVVRQGITVVAHLAASVLGYLAATGLEQYLDNLNI